MNNSEEANKYYKLINEYIDDYLENWKISPKNLKKYLNSNRISNFLEKKGLKEIKNINKVIDDIIQDRISIENDQVMKFESFEIFENSEFSNSNISQCLHRGINKANIDHEKIIADHYDVSLSQIDIVDSNLHKFKIENEEFFIYKEDEIEIIKENLKEWINKKIMNEKVSISVENKEIKLQLSSIIDEDKLKTLISNEIKNVKWIISSILKCQKFDQNAKYFIGSI